MIKETPVIAHWDANLALGSVVAVQAMKMAFRKRRLQDSDSSSSGTPPTGAEPAYYSTLAAHQGCIGVCFVNTESNMPPWGAREPRIGNNPLSIGAPRATGEPVVLDMAMSQAAWFKIVLHNREGRKVPDGWGVDEKAGRPMIPQPS